MYTVIFVDTKGPAKLGTYEDKGACRRAWKMLNAGAAILDESGTVLEHRGGITDAAKRKLDAYAEHLRRQGGMAPPTAPAPVPPRAKVTVERVERVERVEDADEDADEEDATTYTRVEQVDAMVAHDDARAARRESGASTEPPTARPAEVTHALHPATGAVAVGDNTERLTPAAPAATCARKGCTSAPGLDRSNVRPAWRPFCGADRVVIRNRSRTYPGGDAAVIAALRAGTLPPPSERHATLGARGGKAPKRAVAHRATSPAVTLASGLARARLHAEVIAALGGLDAARELAALVEAHGGASMVRDALVGLLDLARAA